MKRVPHRCTTVLLACAGLLASHLIANAEPQPAPAQMTPPRPLFIFGNGGTYTLTVDAGAQAHIDFPGEVIDVTQSHKRPGLDTKKIRDNRVRVAVSENASDGAHINVFVDFLVGHTYFDIFVKKRNPGTKPQNALFQVMLVNQAAFRSMATTIAQPEIDKANKQTKKANERTEREILRSQSKAVLDQLDDRPACDKLLTPEYEARRSADAGQLSWRLLSSCWNEQNVYLLTPFEIDNQSTQPFCVAWDVEVTDRESNTFPARVTYASKPLMKQGDTAVCVGVGEKVRGVVAVAFGNARSISSIKMRLNEPTRARWLGASVSTWALQGIVAAYTGEDWAREVAEKEARDARSTQLILGLRVAYGACRLTSSADREAFESANCTMLGGRLVKGITEMLAFEVDAAGGSTGNADFGTSTRSARIGRVTLGGLLRFGEWTIPYARVGLGAQGVSYENSDASLDIDGLWYVGMGIERRFGTHLLAGVSASFVDSDMRALSAAVYFGYGWNPFPKPIRSIK